MDKKQTAKVFKRIFGFEVGDRVKYKRKSYKGNTYWEYGTLEGIENSYPGCEGKPPYYLVRIRGYLFFFFEEDLELVRRRR